MDTGGRNPLGQPGQVGPPPPIPLPPFATGANAPNSPNAVWPPTAEPPSKKSRRPWFWILLVVGFLFVAAVGFLAYGVALNIWSDSNATKNVPADSELLECYGRDESKQSVPCDGTHHYEVYSASRYPSDSSFPGRVTRSAGLDICDEDFEMHTGVSYYDLSSDLDYSVVYPTEDDWVAGDRLVLCVLHRLDDKPLD